MNHVGFWRRSVEDHARSSARMQECLEACTESDDIVPAEVIEIPGYRSVDDGEYVLLPTSRMCHEDKCLARTQDERSRRHLGRLRSESQEPGGVNGGMDY